MRLEIETTKNGKSQFFGPKKMKTHPITGNAFEISDPFMHIHVSLEPLFLSEHFSTDITL